MKLRHGLEWYDDAPEAALAAAGASGRLVVVDLWAPWCHTCLSMKHFVLSAENFAPRAERFTWLAIDTERAENASFLSRLPVGVWPTFYVISPDLEVFGRWLGAASPAQFARFLDEARETHEKTRALSLPADDVRALLRAADELAMRQQFAEAIAQYERVLAAAPPDWQRLPETLVSLITVTFKAKASERCLHLADRYMNATGRAASAVDFASYSLECAALAPEHALASNTRSSARARLQSLCHEGSPEFSPDDHADACDKLAAAATALSDPEAARAATAARLAVLERAAQGKPDEVAVAYDWARTDALLALGRAEEALALSTARERALPGNYNPPHYSAKSYKQLGRWSEGLAAIDRALALAYGPRRIGLLSIKVDLLLGAQRQAEALAVLRDQLEQYRALPAGQKQPSAEERVQRRLMELSRANLPTPS